MQGLSDHVVKSVEEIEAVMNKGKKHRVTGATAMNLESSRSHAIFTLVVESSQMIADGSTAIRMGKLNLVDLAGSERQSKTQATVWRVCGDGDGDG